MIDDISDIKAFYQRQTENEHTRLERHQLEFDLTWRYLMRHLPASGKILEIGAATGRYTLELARLGYDITAVDLTATLLDLCRERVYAAGLQDRVRYVVADARDLGEIQAQDYDAVLLMGPLYHLVVEADRQLALRQALDKLNPGGVIFSAFISRFGILGDLLQNVPDWIEDQPEVHCLIEKGRDPNDYPHGGFRGYFARAAELAPLHEALGVETIAVAGVEPGISADDASYNRLEGRQRELWLDLFDAVSTEGSTLGASRHLLYVGRKRSL